MSSVETNLFPTFRKFRFWLTEQGGLSLRHLWSVALGVLVILIAAGFFLSLAWRGHLLDGERELTLKTLRLAQAAERTVTALEVVQHQFLVTRQPSDQAQCQRLRTEARAVFLDLTEALRNQPQSRVTVRGIYTQFQQWLKEMALAEGASGQAGRNEAARTPISVASSPLRVALGAFGLLGALK